MVKNKFRGIIEQICIPDKIYGGMQVSIIHFGANALKLDMVQFQSISFYYGGEIRKQPWRIMI